MSRTAQDLSCLEDAIASLRKAWEAEDRALLEALHSPRTIQEQFDRECG